MLLLVLTIPLMILTRHEYGIIVMCESDEITAVAFGQHLAFHGGSVAGVDVERF